MDSIIDGGPYDKLYGGSAGKTKVPIETGKEYLERADKEAYKEKLAYTKTKKTKKIKPTRILEDEECYITPTKASTGVLVGVRHWAPDNNALTFITREHPEYKRLCEGLKEGIGVKDYRLCDHLAEENDWIAVSHDYEEEDFMCKLYLERSKCDSYFIKFKNKKTAATKSKKTLQKDIDTPGLV